MEAKGSSNVAPKMNRPFGKQHHQGQAVPTVYAPTNYGGLYMNQPYLAPQNDQKGFHKKWILALSVLQIIAFALSFLTQIIVMAGSYDMFYNVDFIGAGLWCGVFFGVSGIIGIVVVACKPSKTKAIVFLVFSIFSAIMSTVLFGFAIVGLIVAADSNSYYCGNCSFQDYYCRVRCHQSLQVGIYTTQLVISIATFVFAVTTSSLSCCMICCTSDNVQGVVLSPQVIVVGPGQGQVFQPSAPMMAYPTAQYPGNQDPPPQYY